jgi:hypothetical protein
MRTREEIEKQIEPAEFLETEALVANILSLEVLLDIRDLLIDNKKN